MDAEEQMFVVEEGVDGYTSVRRLSRRQRVCWRRSDSEIVDMLSAALGLNSSDRALAEGAFNEIPDFVALLPESQTAPTLDEHRLPEPLSSSVAWFMMGLALPRAPIIVLASTGFPARLPPGDWPQRPGPSSDLADALGITAPPTDAAWPGDQAIAAPPCSIESWRVGETPIADSSTREGQQVFLAASSIQAAHDRFSNSFLVGRILCLGRPVSYGFSGLLMQHASVLYSIVVVDDENVLLPPKLHRILVRIAYALSTGMANDPNRGRFDLDLIDAVSREAWSLERWIKKQVRHLKSQQLIARTGTFATLLTDPGLLQFAHDLLAQSDDGHTARPFLHRRN